MTMHHLAVPVQTSGVSMYFKVCAQQTHVEFRAVYSEYMLHECMCIDISQFAQALPVPASGVSVQAEAVAASCKAYT